MPLVFETHCSGEQPTIPPSENSQTAGVSWDHGWELEGPWPSLRPGWPATVKQATGESRAGNPGKERRGGTGRQKSSRCPAAANTMGTERSFDEKSDVLYYLLAF